MKDVELPIITCEECERLTFEQQGVLIVDSESPSLCDVCFEATRCAWEMYHDTGTDPKELESLLPKLRARFLN